MRLTGATIPAVMMLSGGLLLPTQLAVANTNSLGTAGSTITASASDGSQQHADSLALGQRSTPRKGRRSGPNASRSSIAKSQNQLNIEFNIRAYKINRARVDAYDRRYQAYEDLKNNGGCDGLVLTAACAEPPPPMRIDTRTTHVYSANQPAAAAPVIPQYTPQQAAQIAVAQLTVPTLKPGISPAPDLNRWKMAVVGYPLWLYADGATHVGPVTDTVGDLSVSLDASLASVSYAMGDGQTKVCQGAGTKWTEAVAPGTPSPDCGYAYQKASLPAGDYTVTATATWSVTWQINGETGVLPVTTTSATQLPVGELQAVIVAEHR